MWSGHTNTSRTHAAKRYVGSFLNTLRYILYFTHLFVTFTLGEVLSFDNKNKKTVICFVLFSLIRNFAAEIKNESVMCTVTLSYNEKDKVASEKLAALLSTGLFVQLNTKEDISLVKG